MAQQNFTTLRLVFAVAACLGFAGAAPAANYVDSQNREWLDMTLVTGSSWNSINSVCQSATETPGACAGLASSGYDLTGWTWAGRDEVVDLIQSFMVADGDNTAEAVILSQNGHGTQDHAWAAALIAAMGQTSSNDLRSFGFMNGLDQLGFNTTGQAAFICSGPSCGWESYVGAGVSAGVSPAQSNAAYAGWFYREAAAVPEPSTLFIGLAGLACLGAVRRRVGVRSSA